MSPNRQLNKHSAVGRVRRQADDCSASLLSCDETCGRGRDARLRPCFAFDGSISGNSSLFTSCPCWRALASSETFEVYDRAHVMTCVSWRRPAPVVRPDLSRAGSVFQGHIRNARDCRARATVIEGSGRSLKASPSRVPRSNLLLLPRRSSSPLPSAAPAQWRSRASTASRCCQCG